MAKFAVYIKQVNQERIIVDAEDPSDARYKALKEWQDNYLYNLVMDVMLLPEEKE